LQHRIIEAALKLLHASGSLPILNDFTP